jgi:hypothetical protein
MVTEFKEMQKWDAMLQSLDVLDEQVKAYPVTHVGTFLSTYGVPGEQALWQVNCAAQGTQQHGAKDGAVSLM